MSGVLLIWQALIVDGVRFSPRGPSGKFVPVPLLCCAVTLEGGSRSDRCSVADRQSALLAGSHSVPPVGLDRRSADR